MQSLGAAPSWKVHLNFRARWADSRLGDQVDLPAAIAEGRLASWCDNAEVQLLRKVEAVEKALTEDVEWASAHSVEAGEMPLTIRGWIVDTSIEHGHQRFNGFLKVSLEEVLVGLRDDRHLLNDPGGLFESTGMAEFHDERAPLDELPTLYPDGFSLPGFVEVIESEAVWVESFDGQPDG